MRYFLLTVACAGLAGAAQAQTWETSAHLTAAGFRFRGASAFEDSYIRVANSTARTGYTSNPFGARWGGSYGVAVQQQRVTKGGILLGLQAGYERLRSRVDTRGVIWNEPSNQLGYGRTHLNNDFLNLHPFLGQRTTFGPLALDLSAGVDLGLLLHCREKGRFKANDGSRYTSDRQPTPPRLDLRPRLNLAVYYRRVGLTLGYSLGLTNYRRGVVGGVNEAYSQACRLGVAYRLF